MKTVNGDALLLSFDDALVLEADLPTEWDPLDDGGSDYQRWFDDLNAATARASLPGLTDHYFRDNPFMAALQTPRPTQHGFIRDIEAPLRYDPEPRVYEVPNEPDDFVLGGHPVTRAVAHYAARHNLTYNGVLLMPYVPAALQRAYDAAVMPGDEFYFHDWQGAFTEDDDDRVLAIASDHEVDRYARPDHDRDGLRLHEPEPLQTYCSLDLPSADHTLDLSHLRTCAACLHGCPCAHRTQPMERRVAAGDRWAAFFPRVGHALGRPTEPRHAARDDVGAPARGALYDFSEPVSEAGHWLGLSRAGYADVRVDRGERVAPREFAVPLTITDWDESEQGGGFSLAV